MFISESVGTSAGEVAGEFCAIVVRVSFVNYYTVFFART